MGLSIMDFQVALPFSFFFLYLLQCYLLINWRKQRLSLRASLCNSCVIPLNYSSILFPTIKITFIFLADRHIWNSEALLSTCKPNCFSARHSHSQNANFPGHSFTRLSLPFPPAFKDALHHPNLYFLMGARGGICLHISACS